jgi:hypothetical protein
MQTSEEVMGAAAGVGLFLLIAVTILLYRYYALLRSAKEWGELERKAVSSQLADERSALGKSGPHKPTYSVIHKVSASFIHSVPFHLF